MKYNTVGACMGLLLAFLGTFMLVTGSIQSDVDMRLFGVMCLLIGSYTVAILDDGTKYFVRVQVTMGEEKDV